MLQAHTAILMATYNGARHLREQIDSILAQTDRDWTLFVHDDGSADDTMAILREYAAAHSQVVVLDYPPSGGARANFLGMMQQVEAQYYLFADQDDVWLSDKVRLTREEMLLQEAAHPHSPVVVHTDLTVADEQLNVVAQSFWRYTATRPEFITTFDECVLPFVTGCTMMFNAEARKATILPAREATMHDVWVTLCCMSKGGVVSTVPTPQVLYRQHGDNAIGARDIHTVGLRYRLGHLLTIVRNNKAHYLMLRRLGYGPVWKYIRHKIIYRDKVRHSK